MRHILLVMFSALAWAGALPAAAQTKGALPPPVAAIEPWARASAGSVGAAYVTLANRAKPDVGLVGARSDAAERVELHASSIEGGVMQMRPVDAVPVPGNGRAALAPGGYHLMLIGLKKPLVAGQTIVIFLKFDNAQPELAATFRIYPAGHPGPGKGR